MPTGEVNTVLKVQARRPAGLAASSVGTGARTRVGINFTHVTQGRILITTTDLAICMDEHVTARVALALLRSEVKLGALRSSARYRQMGAMTDHFRRAIPFSARDAEFTDSFLDLKHSLTSRLYQCLDSALPALGGTVPKQPLPRDGERTIP
jgi:hypothetical protein